jgi:hypothetical protein
MSHRFEPLARAMTRRSTQLAYAADDDYADGLKPILADARYRLASRGAVTAFYSDLQLTCLGAPDIAAPAGAAKGATGVLRRCCCWTSAGMRSGARKRTKTPTTFLSR